VFRVAICLASALSDRKTGAEPADSVQNRGKGHDIATTKTQRTIRTIETAAPADVDVGLMVQDSAAGAW
jgi:hypothetical protein